MGVPETLLVLDIVGFGEEVGLDESVGLGKKTVVGEEIATEVSLTIAWSKQKSLYGKFLAEGGTEDMTITTAWSPLAKDCTLYIGRLKQPDEVVLRQESSSTKE